MCYRVATMRQPNQLYFDGEASKLLREVRKKLTEKVDEDRDTDETPGREESSDWTTHCDDPAKRRKNVKLNSNEVLQIANSFDRKKDGVYH